MLIGSGDLPPQEGPTLRRQPPPPPLRPPPTGFTHIEKPIVVAIIDTGIDTQAYHSLLWENPLEIENGRDDDNNGLIDDLHGWNTAARSEDIYDTHGHGTHVAGIIVSQIKILQSLSLQHRPIQFMILKYFDKNANGNANMNASLEAFRYAIDHDAQIINYSGGGMSASLAEEDLIREALLKNILIVAAAGNDATNVDAQPFYPAGYEFPNVIGVGATDANLVPVPSSNFGRRTVDLTAPGQKILSTLPQGRSGYMTGTSQATAFVTAAAALILARSPDSIPVEFVIDRLLSTAQSYAHLRFSSRSGAQLDLLRAVTQADSQSLPTGQKIAHKAGVPDHTFASGRSAFEFIPDSTQP